ncbi:MAG: hypothetical protein LQ342_000086 [Letrouitia transgressa]|nr:MAG: hypothetical protein LQ342_000086 [Letrouitia transgressa]
MASLPRQPSSSTQRQSSFQRRASPPPTADVRRSNSSQSSKSEDSQTVILNQPLSRDHSPDARSKQKQVVLSSGATPGSEPKRCWICFSDETDDNPPLSEWRSPCPCALTAHESCLLDWVADLEGPSHSSQAPKIQCPQCKADITVTRPRSYVVDGTKAVQGAAERMVTPIVVVSIISTVALGCTAHGLSTAMVTLGPKTTDRLLGLNKKGPPSSWAFTLPLVPVVLVLSRTPLADSIFPILPILYLTRGRPTRESRSLWPPSVAMTLAMLPYLRAVYNGLYKRYVAPRDKAWAKEVLPRAEENRDNDQADEPEPAAAVGEELAGMNFELGVELEIIEEEEVAPENARPREGQRLEDPVGDGAAAAPAPPDIQARRIDAAANDRAQAPQAGEQGENNNDGDRNEQAPAPPHRHRHREFNFSIGELTKTIVGALVFPSIAATMGGLLKATLPAAWTTPPITAGFWDRRGGRNEGFLHSRFGRSVAGGCLFIVLKDSLMLYARYRTAKDHRKRRVVDYEGVKGKARRER